MSLPSSPHDYRGQASERSGVSEYPMNDELESTWNKVLQSPMFNDRTLLPYEEWNIDFTELTVGTRVGIGTFSFPLEAVKIMSFNFFSVLFSITCDLSMDECLK